MGYVDKINDVLNNIDLGKPIFEVRIGSNEITLNENGWDPDLDESICIDGFISKYARRRYSKTDKEYYVDIETTTTEIEHDVMRKILDVFIKCSPNTKPRRTNIFRNFYHVVEQNRNVQEFKNSIFDIYEYYFNSTLTETIDHNNNDVHRKNIYQLLCLMEKSYGKKTSR